MNLPPGAVAVCFDCEEPIDLKAAVLVTRVMANGRPGRVVLCPGCAGIGKNPAVMH